MYINVFLPVRSYIFEVRENVRKVNYRVIQKLSHATLICLSVTRICL